MVWVQAWFYNLCHTKVAGEKSISLIYSISFSGKKKRIVEEVNKIGFKGNLSIFKDSFNNLTVSEVVFFKIITQLIDRKNYKFRYKKKARSFFLRKLKVLLSLRCILP